MNLMDCLDTLREWSIREPRRFTFVFRKLYILLSRTIKKEECRNQFMEVFIELLTKGLDRKALNRLRKLYHNIVGRSSHAMTKSRSRSRVNDIKHILDTLSNQCMFLDIGCGDGSITRSITEYLGLPRHRAHAVDVITQNPSDLYTFSSTNGKILDYESNSFDIVTIFMASHHFEYPVHMFKEIYRVIKPGGMLVIREHDIVYSEQRMFIDLAHVMYANVINDEGDIGPLWYRTAKEWSSLITSVGFIEKELKKQYDIFQSYYAVYVTSS